MYKETWRQAEDEIADIERDVVLWRDRAERYVRDMEIARRRVITLEQVVEDLLDGLDANHEPERCGLSNQQWDRRIERARTVLRARAR